MKPHVTFFCLLTLIGSTESSLLAQGFGGFGGAGGYGNARNTGAQSAGAWYPGSDLMRLDTDSALNYITIDGTAELRVVPEEIRVVLAITSEGDLAQQCQDDNAKQVQAVLQAWDGLALPKKKIVEDFINVLPKYEWRLTERDGQQVRIQQRSGYRMQTNLHIAVPDEKAAMAAINQAFKAGVTDIVTFDYWSSRLNQQREQARIAAVLAAKKKAETLLAVFDAPPKVINVQENTRVFFPHSLYRTYENVLEEEVTYNNRNLPAIKAFRPKMTFFHGLQSHSDDRPTELAMHPEIAIVSTVRIYYQSPAEKRIRIHED